MDWERNAWKVWDKKKVQEEQRKDKYSTALTSYLGGVLKQLAEWLAAGNVQKLVVVIAGQDSGETLERWVFDVQTDKLTGFSTRSILCAPVLDAGVTVSVIEALNKEDDRGFDEEDVFILKTICDELRGPLRRAAAEEAFKQRAAATDSEFGYLQQFTSAAARRGTVDAVQSARYHGEGLEVAFIDYVVGPLITVVVKLFPELADLEVKAIEYKADAEKRQEKVSKHLLRCLLHIAPQDVALPFANLIHALMTDDALYAANGAIHEPDLDALRVVLGVGEELAHDASRQPAGALVCLQHDVDLRADGDVRAVATVGFAGAHVREAVLRGRTRHRRTTSA